MGKLTDEASKWPSKADGKLIVYGKGRNKCSVVVYGDGNIFVQLEGQAALASIVDGVGVAIPDAGGVWVYEKDLPDVLPDVAKDWPRLRAKILDDVRKLQSD